MKRFILTLMLICFASCFVAGCNTVAGAGKDVKAAGEEVEEAAHH